MLRKIIMLYDMLKFDINKKIDYLLYKNKLIFKNIIHISEIKISGIIN